MNRTSLRAASLRLVLGLAALSFALEAFAGPGKPARKLVNVADTRGMAPGFSRFVADVYNSSHWLYALMVILLMAGMGTVLGLVFDKLVGRLGIDLGRIEHHE